VNDPYCVANAWFRDSAEYLDSGIQRAYVVTFQAFGSRLIEFRIGLTYDYDQPSCPVIAWDRLNEQRTQQYWLMLPSGNMNSSPGAGARGGNNGERWYFNCPTSDQSPTPRPDCNPPGGMLFDTPTKVRDVT